ncbi:MAG TPA: PhzF family phenazine biosynthesis protein [Cellvibrionaceae bacterium]
MTEAIAETTQGIQVSTFYGELTQGNRHRVLLLENDTVTTVKALEKLSMQSDEIVIGLCWKADTPSATFFHRGQSILRCGSGNLACAFVLNSLYGLRAQQQLHTEDGPITLLVDNDRYGYQTYHRLGFAESEDPLFHPCVNLPPDHTILCGGDTDYLVFVYNRAESLVALEADIQHICQSTQRALIATAPCQQSDADYVIRYFAPQWGNNEDAATGSAHAIVGPYWGKRLGLRELHSYQASAQGGEFWVRLGPADADGQAVTLLGRCRQS